MRGEPAITGTVFQYEEPVWEPLVSAVGGHQAGWFMWMFEIEFEDKSRVHAYKHVSTRRYLHLAEDGRAFVYVGDDRYRQINLELAADLALAGWVPDEDEQRPT